MSFFSSITSFFSKAAVTTEADAVAFSMKVWAEAQIVEKDVIAVANWIVNEIPVLTAGIARITPLVDAIVGLADPTIAAKMAALNAAMAGLNAFAASTKAGTLTPDQAVAGYSSLKAASAAVQELAATASNIIAVTPASKPS